MFSSAAQAPGSQIADSDFRDKVAEGSVAEVRISEEMTVGTLKNKEAFSTIPVANDPDLTRLLADHGVKYAGLEKEEMGVFAYILIHSLPFLLILGIAFFALHPVHKGVRGGAMGLGKN